MATIIKCNRPSNKESIKMERLQKEWLKKNKPTRCPDVYLDNPYKQSIYSSTASADSSGGSQ